MNAIEHYFIIRTVISDIGKRRRRRRKMRRSRVLCLICC